MLFTENNILWNTREKKLLTKKVRRRGGGAVATPSPPPHSIYVLVLALPMTTANKQAIVTAQIIY